MGLSGSGKTYLAKPLASMLNAAYFNADKVREEYNDWDFTSAGRKRQAYRMKELADKSDTEDVVLDFICPTSEYRNIVRADFVVWMNTTKSSKYKDTDNIFSPPNHTDIEISEISNNNIENVYNLIELKRRTL